MARRARISSRMRGAGCDHGIEKRLVMCGLICEPSPRTIRPPDCSWRSWALCASVMGLRAKATVIEVMSSSRSVCSAASASGRNGSLSTSAVIPPS